MKSDKEDYGEDFMISCGEFAVGKFQLHDDSLGIVFDVDNVDGSYVHWHPADRKKAIRDVVTFIQGNNKY